VPMPRSTAAVAYIARARLSLGLCGGRLAERRIGDLMVDATRVP
jgi:hypothetical protein